MEANLSPIDRIIRVVLGIVSIGVGLFAMRGIPRILLGVLGDVAVFSGTIGFCHIYKFFGVCSATSKS